MCFTPFPAYAKQPSPELQTLIGERPSWLSCRQPDAEIDVTALSGHCRKQLAAYKYPTEIRIVLDLPKTITGKIRRNPLRDDIRSH